jgi:hypothetical protein
MRQQKLNISSSVVVVRVVETQQLTQMLLVAVAQAVTGHQQVLLLQQV